MSSAAPPASPGSRVLAGWWKQLEPLRPSRLWVGQLALHHVEALVRVRRSQAVDPVTRLVLRCLEITPGRTLTDLAASLHLDRQVLRQLLRRGEEAGLVEPAGDAGWSVTPLGREAQRGGQFAQVDSARRPFTFVESEPAGPHVHFLDVSAPECLPGSPPDAAPFNPGVLAACVQQPAGWKRRHGFPEDVQEVLAGSAPGAAPPWRQVVLDRPARLFVVLALVPQPEGAEALYGFAVRPDGWALQTSRPAFVLREGWPEVFPGLAHEPGTEAWRSAWRAWCEPRNLPAEDVAACVPEREGVRLRVQVPSRLLERLQALRSDALKGETWLVAGSGSLRPAARIEIVRPGP
jgi:hypothetical protein